LHQPTLQRQRGGEVHEVADEVGRSIGRPSDLQAPAGVPDEDVARDEHRRHRLEPAGHRRGLVHARTVTRYIDCDRLVPEALELGDRAAPAPRTVEPAVHENETHRNPF
jgi:hypothetical protein